MGFREFFLILLLIYSAVILFDLQFPYDIEINNFNKKNITIEYNYGKKIY